MAKNPRSKQKEMIGSVVSIAGDTTVIVQVVQQWRHPFYKKLLRRTKNIAVHAEGGKLRVGDAVRIGETRPISKTKHYRVVQKL